MVLKSSEKELARKAAYYQANKDKILARKHSRQKEIYHNKQMRAISSDEEWEKDQVRNLAKLEHGMDKHDKCDLCGKTPEELGYPLERHEMDYDPTKIEVVWLCKPCHAEADKFRRRNV